MKRSLWVSTVTVLLLAGAAAAPAQTTCAAGSTARLTITNSCGDDAWVIETPPGAVAAVQGQWNWFLAYATQTLKLGNGGSVAGVLVKKGTSTAFCVPDMGAPGGNFRFYMGCPSNNTDPFNNAGCTIGAAAGDLAGINTLFEPTFGCKPGLSGAQCAFNPSSNPADYPNCAASPSSANCQAMPSGDNFDISAVDGYTFPIKVVAQPTSGSAITIDAGMLDLASCPTETSKTLYSTDSTQQGLINGGVSLLTTNGAGQLQACAAPYKWFMTGTLGTPKNTAPSSGACSPSITSACFYAAAGCDNSQPVTGCPGGSGPQQKVGPKGDGTVAIQNTNWVQQLYMLGYNGYTWQYGDGVGNQSAPWGTSYTVTLCPNGGTPYVAGQLWAFSATTGACSTNGQTGTPNNQTTYGSLFACQTANMRYTCDNYTSVDPYGSPTGLWKADPAATLAKTGQTYAQVQGRTLTCKDYTLQIPTGGGFTPNPSPATLTLPECNYFWSGTSVCPGG